MTASEQDKIREIAAKIDSMAAAVNGLTPTDSEKFGMWLILSGAAKELEDLADQKVDTSAVSNR